MSYLGWGSVNTNETVFICIGLGRNPYIFPEMVRASFEAGPTCVGFSVETSSILSASNFTLDAFAGIAVSDLTEAETRSANSPNRHPPWPVVTTTTSRSGKIMMS